MGLKTTYYLRTLAASQVEKSTVNTSEHGSTHLRKKDDSPVNASSGSAPTSVPSSIAHTQPSNVEMASVQQAPAPVLSSTVISAPSPITAAEVTPVAVMAAASPKKKYNIEVIGDAVCEACE